MTADCEEATAYNHTTYGEDGTVVQHYGGSRYADGTVPLSLEEAFISYVGDPTESPSLFGRLGEAS